MLFPKPEPGVKSGLVAAHDGYEAERARAQSDWWLISPMAIVTAVFLLLGAGIGIGVGIGAATWNKDATPVPVPVPITDINDGALCPTTFNEPLTAVPALATCTVNYASVRTSTKKPTSCLQHLTWKTPLKENSAFQNFYYAETGGFNNPLNNLIPQLVGAWLPQGIMNCPGTLATLVWMNEMLPSIYPHPQVCDDAFQEQFRQHNKVYYWEDTHGLGPDNGLNGAKCTKYVWRYAYFAGIIELECEPTTCPSDSPTDAELQAYADSTLSGHANPKAYEAEWTTVTAALSSLGGVHLLNAMWQIYNCRKHDGAALNHYEITGTYGGLGTAPCSDNYGNNYTALKTGHTWSMLTCDVADNCPVSRTVGSHSLETVRSALWNCQSYDKNGDLQASPYEAIWKKMNSHYAPTGSNFRAGEALALYDLYKPRSIA
jgi:hypothetical protein